MNDASVKGIGGATSRGDRPARRTLTALLLVIDAMVLVLTIFQVHGTLRYTVALIFGLTVPGWSVVGFLKIKDVALLVSLTFAASLAGELVLGEIMLARWWHLQLFEMMLCAVCGYLLWRQLNVALAPEDES